jgi:NAD(P)-dependent dehydrogenase (short-subunit alcohol dehydrogenase family)
MNSPEPVRDFDGRVALVTGASGGIGRLIALDLSKRGARVFVNGRTPDTLATVVKEIEHLGGWAAAVPGDVTVPDQAVAVVDAAAEGGLDFAVLSGAGITPTGALFKLFQDMELSDLIPNAEAHWLSKAYLAHAALRHMVPRGYGKIVALSTDAGRVPTTNESMIGASAAALMQMFRVLGREVGRFGIRTNVVSCGPVIENVPVAAAPMEGLEHHGQSVLNKLDRRRIFPVSGRDVASAVGFLLSPGGDNVTGQTWSVNGGISMVG